MSRVERSALVPYSAARMFALVNDVEGYPRRFSWCNDARVVERGESCMLARMDLKMGGVRAVFTTRNRWVEDSRIELGLVEGPFKALGGIWEFRPLAEHACKVSLQLDFAFAGRLVGSALASGFRRLADSMVDDFVRAARIEAGGVEILPAP